MCDIEKKKLYEKFRKYNGGDQHYCLSCGQKVHKNIEESVREKANILYDRAVELSMLATKVQNRGSEIELPSWLFK